MASFREQFLLFCENVYYAVFIKNNIKRPIRKLFGVTLELNEAI